MKIAGQLGLAGLLALGLAGAASPAAAFDEGRGSTLDALMGILGVGGEKEEQGSIDYRERPPLVLPPKTDLRQPKPPVAQRAANWPQDQEAVAAARRRAAAGRPRLDRTEEGQQQLAARELATNRLAPGQRGPRECAMDTDPTRVDACTPDQFWSSLKVKKEEALPLQAGVEPERKYLTQPPKGYLKTTKSVKATFEAPQRVTDEDSARSFFRRAPTQE